MKLIVNADDFGMSRGINYGIIDACRLGIVRSASLIACGKAYAHAVELAKQTPLLGVGVELSLTYGYPLLRGHRTLTDANGRFLSLNAVYTSPGRLSAEEVEAEFCAQVDFVLASGIEPSHISSVDNIHLLEAFFPIACRVARKYALAIRIPRRGLLPLPYTALRSCDLSLSCFNGTCLDDDFFLRLLTNHQHVNVLEIVCRPGYADRMLLSEPYSIPRVNEFHILTSMRVCQFIVRNRIELCNYTCLSSFAGAC